METKGRCGGMLAPRLRRRQLGAWAHPYATPSTAIMRARAVRWRMAFGSA